MMHVELDRSASGLPRVRCMACGGIQLLPEAGRAAESEAVRLNFERDHEACGRRPPRTEEARGWPEEVTAP